MKLKDTCFKLWCWRRLESPLDSKEIKPVNPKGNQPWIFIRRTDAEVEVPVFGLLMRTADTGKDLGAGKDWERKERRAAENEMVGWHHWFSGYELGQTLRWWGTERPGMLQSMSHKELDTAWLLTTKRRDVKIILNRKKSVLWKNRVITPDKAL